MEINYHKSAKQCCCYQCPDRTVEPNCHADCERYKDYKKSLVEYRKEQVEQNKKWCGLMKMARPAKVKEKKEKYDR